MVSETPEMQAFSLHGMHELECIQDSCAWLVLGLSFAWELAWVGGVCA